MVQQAVLYPWRYSTLLPMTELFFILFWNSECALEIRLNLVLILLLLQNSQLAACFGSDFNKAQKHTLQYSWWEKKTFKFI